MGPHKLPAFAGLRLRLQLKKRPASQPFLLLSPLPPRFCAPDASDYTVLDVNSYLYSSPASCPWFTRYGATMPPKFKDGDVVLCLNAKWVSWAHTAVAYSENHRVALPFLRVQILRLCNVHTAHLCCRN